MAFTAAVIGDVPQQPVDGVAGVGGLVDIGLGLVFDHGPVHHELAFGAVAPADIGLDEDVAACRQLRLGRVDTAGGSTIYTVGSALHQERQRLAARLRALRSQEDGVQLRAIAHRNHDLAADILPEVVQRHSSVADAHQSTRTSGAASSARDCQP